MLQSGLQGKPYIMKPLFHSVKLQAQVMSQSHVLSDACPAGFSLVNTDLAALYAATLIHLKIGFHN
jgi:hypothetical protein